MGFVIAFASAPSTSVMPRVLSPIPNIDCAKFCHPTKSWSLYESNFPAQTWSFATSKQFLEKSLTSIQVQYSVAARVAVGLNQDKMGAGCAGTKQAEQEA